MRKYTAADYLGMIFIACVVAAGCSVIYGIWEVWEVYGYVKSFLTFVICAGLLYFVASMLDE